MPKDPLNNLSPLRLLTRSKSLNAFINKLQNLRFDLDNSAIGEHTFRVSRREIQQARRAFSKMILKGEESLHLLCELFSEKYLKSYQIESQVIGQIDSSGERFNLSQTITSRELYTTTDIDLGNRQINKLQFLDNGTWSKAMLVSNVVSYQSTKSNAFAIHRILSRIKAEEEIWNKVADEIFDLDQLVSRDKKLRHLGRYVKDIFGLKIIVNEAADADRIFKDLNTPVIFKSDLLKKFELDANDETSRLQLVEFKDYLTPKNRKRSGWEAYKAVFKWNGRMFEIQIQTLHNFLRERELLTHESHDGYKIKRELIRDRVSADLPLYSFYRDLLRWLFLNPHGDPPKYNGLTIEIID